MSRAPQEKKTCGVDGCLGKMVAHGYCSKHSHRFIRHGHPLGGGPPHRKHGSERPICRFEHCTKPVLANGMCHMHNNRWEAQGRPESFDGKTMRELRQPKQSECSIGGCSRRAMHRGYCRLHYGRWLTHGDAGPAGLKIKRGNGRSPIEVWHCDVDGCMSEALVGKLCKDHYMGAVRASSRSAAIDIDAGHIGAYGYVKVRVQPDPLVSCGANIPEHRLIMSLLLGRPLRSDENVHHKNGDRGDNRPSNLELWVKPQPAGQRVEDVIAWAKDILKRYRKFDPSVTVESPQLELIVGGKSVG